MVGLPASPSMNTIGLAYSLFSLKRGRLWPILLKKSPLESGALFSIGREGPRAGNEIRRRASVLMGAITFDRTFRRAETWLLYSHNVIVARDIRYVGLRVASRPGA